MPNCVSKTAAKAALITLVALSSATTATATDTTVTATGEGISWYGYRSNSTVSFSYDTETGTTSITNLDANSYVWGYLPSTTVLAIGDSITFSATVTFASVTSSGVFYFGLYNCGENTQPEESSTSYSSIIEATYDMTGIFAGTKSETTTVYYRYEGKAPTISDDGTSSGGAGFMTTNQGSAYITSATLSTALSAPEASTEYDFCLTIVRTETGLTISLGTDETVSFDVSSDEEISYNVIAFKSPGSGITLTNLSVVYTAAVPEPSAIGLFAGIAAIAFTATRRRRSRR